MSCQWVPGREGAAAALVVVVGTRLSVAFTHTHTHTHSEGEDEGSDGNPVPSMNQRLSKCVCYCVCGGFGGGVAEVVASSKVNAEILSHTHTPPCYFFVFPPQRGRCKDIQTLTHTCTHHRFKAEFCI